MIDCIKYKTNFDFVYLFVDFAEFRSTQNFNYTMAVKDTADGEAGQCKSFIIRSEM